MENEFKKTNRPDPLAVITGASSGIGLELAKVFAKNGFDLLIVAENDEIFAARKQLAESGIEVHAHQIDLANIQGVDDLIAKINLLNRPVEVVAINAGVGVSGAFADNNVQAEMNMLNLNVVSSVYLAKHMVRKMLKDGRGKILFTSSIAATMPGSFYAVYAASKAFIQSFAMALRNELADSNITVASLMSGATDINFFHRAHMEDTKAGQSKKDDPAVVAQNGFEALMAASVRPKSAEPQHRKH